ncbi:MAG: DUF1835 domain-containing protein [Lentisphaerae bacterium]|nr:DUF1835 domain-containing protein [Lentisphaerota bacterium]
MLHVHTGDAAAAALTRSGIGGEQAVWTDVLMVGPLCADLASDAARRQRAEVLSASTGGAISPARCRHRLERQDESLRAWREHDEVVLWTDSCLYDQMILVRLLAWFEAVPEALPRLRLIGLDSHPAVPVFHGLGQLSPAQLAALLPARVAVTAAQLRTGRRVWDALCQTTPHDIEALAADAFPGLPFLGTALRRWLELYPAVENGLCRLQQEVLEALTSSPGPMAPPALFAAVSERERPAFFGDTMLWQMLNAMASCRHPLLHLDGAAPLPQWDTQGIGARRVTISATGRAVAMGLADAIRLNGIDRWLGGVHLDGTPEHDWRWNRAAGRLQRGPLNQGGSCSYG